jgi:hypothetical protein
MELNPLYESHIRRVGVTFEMFGPHLDPTALTAAVGIKPDMSAKCGDERRNYGGQLLTPHEKGWWALDSRKCVDSKDINDHFQYLLSLLMPHKEIFSRVGEGGYVSFGVLWESTYLYAGTGPMLGRDVIAGVATLKGEINFDIYQIDEPDFEEDL